MLEYSFRSKCYMLEKWEKSNPHEKKMLKSKLFKKEKRKNK